MRRLVLAGAAGLSLAAAAHADARVFTIGSNLKADANRKESAPVDSVYWATKASRRVRSPRKGRVVGMRLKGRINPTGANPPNVAMHLQTLRPAGGGKVRVIATTGNLGLPFGGDRNHIWSYDSNDIINLCVKKGDYVGLSTSGGYGPDGYPDGAEFAVFGTRGGSSYKGFTGAGQNLNGSVAKGRTRRGKELLMQVKIATGKAAGVCRL